MIASLADEPVARHNVHADDQSLPNENAQPVDEATLIEERRKRREAIKARHRGQVTPLLVQALAPDKALSIPEAQLAGAVLQDQAASK